MRFLRRKEKLTAEEEISSTLLGNQKIYSEMEDVTMHVTMLVQLLPTSVVDNRILGGVSDPNFPILFVRVIDSADQKELASDAVKKAMGVLKITELCEARVWHFGDKDREPDISFTSMEVDEFVKET